jgi:hypothetical protein
VHDVIDADRIQADVVFANTCMSWRPGHGLVAADFQLTSAFQRGFAAAYIGAVHQMVPNVRLNDLVHAAAQAGADVGRLGRMLNEHVQLAGDELPHFVVLGLPWVTPFTAAEPLPAHPEGSDRPGPSDGLSPSEDLRSERRDLGRTIEALREFPQFGFMPPDGLPAIDAEIEDLVTRISESTSAASIEAGGDPLQRLRVLVRDVELTVAADFHDFGKMSYSGLDELWQSVLETSIRPIDACCPYCAGRLAELVGRHPLYERIARNAQVCDICGPVYDLPATPVVEPIFIKCPTVWKSPGVVGIEIQITPAASLSRHITVSAAVHMSGSERYGLSFPDAQQVTVQPGRQALIKVEAQVSEHAFVHHEHFVRAIVMAQGMVHYASRPIAVQPLDTMGDSHEE